MAQATTDYSHRSVVQKLGVKPDERVEVVGDVGAGLRRDVKEVARPRPRALRRAGWRDRDGRVDRGGRGGLRRYRPRLRDTGYLWLITPKRGQEGYVNQMALVPGGKQRGLIDNKTCSIDEERSGIRFVVPRALRGGAQSAAA